MYDLAEIKKMNRISAKKAKGKMPYVAAQDKDPLVNRSPDFGDYSPAGWELVETYFVDNSGFGSPGEPALTFSQLIEKVKAGYGYAIIKTGQFQVYIGEFKKIAESELDAEVLTCEKCGGIVGMNVVKGKIIKAQCPNCK
jgi:hypothetical protein